MNIKRAYRPGNDYKAPEYLHEVSITRGSKTYAVNKGTLLSVYRKPGLIAGKYEFLYAERVGGVMLYHVEGPESRAVSDRRRRVLRDTDIKAVHVKTRRKE